MADAVWPLKVFNLLRPYRRQASSHRCCTGFNMCAVPVGAGLPAIGPVQVKPSPGSSTLHCHGPR
ncbi:hypothetical protein D0894_07420 [Pseudomonas monteilii]|uniref:Uncharacterized protein n=1 Tax=Pseudomonas monteilii TaxID=76759 RepID=A0A399MAD8_9PSED|nr:hypothetical protein D0894_07420 [Pseudomonas monteilii]